jgi:hypothetical protein
VVYGELDIPRRVAQVELSLTVASEMVSLARRRIRTNDRLLPLPRRA